MPDQPLDHNPVATCAISPFLTFILPPPSSPTLHSRAHRRECRITRHLARMRAVVSRGHETHPEFSYGEQIENLWTLQRLDCGEPAERSQAFHTLQAQLRMRYSSPELLQEDDHEDIPALLECDPEGDYGDPQLLHSDEAGSPTAVVRGSRVRDMSKL
ncbi:hypothetical protein DFH06DRAFT_1344051 [Mycena polygramma]|nr:hypothetical protein DFH06DRAFT_1344051 [Mycena polygramma]